MASGRLGHRVVISRIAAKQLTPRANAAIAESLEPGESLADASLWADENQRYLSGRQALEGPNWHQTGLPAVAIKNRELIKATSALYVAPHRRTRDSKITPDCLLKTRQARIPTNLTNRVGA